MDQAVLPPQDNPPQTAPVREAIISARDVVVGFGEKIILNGLSLDVYRGEILAIVGGSGQGATGELQDHGTAVLETLHQRNDVAVGLLTGNIRAGARVKLRRRMNWSKANATEVTGTLEARGLDATPQIQHKLRSVGTPHALRAVAVLDIILRDEVGHVAIGNRWYRWLCERQGLAPVAHYKVLVQRHRAPRLRPPFNTPAREAAGFSAEEIAYLAGDGVSA